MSEPVIPNAARAAEFARPAVATPASARRRIAIVGAGSAYMPSVIRGLIARADSLAGSELVFYDIATDHVELLARLATGMFAAAEARYRVVTASTLDQAVADSDFVFTTLRPGGLPARHLDETIPLRYGVLGQETIGPGGFLMACRSVPALLRIAEAVDRLAPKAWIVNYTNPTNIVTDALLRFGGMSRVVGLCDQYVGDQRRWATILGLDPHGLEIDWYGTNHCSWATTVRTDGVDISARIEEMLDALDPDAFTDPDVRQFSRLAHDFGYLVNSYARYYYFHDDIVAALRAKGTSRAQDIMAELPDMYADFADEADKQKPDPKRSRGGAGWGEFAVEAICAIAGDERRRIVVNTRNDGAIPELEDSAVVEVPAIVGADGPRALRTGPLPHPARGLTQAVHEYEWLAAEAAALGSRRRALQALMAHPLIRTRTQAAGILSDGLAEHRAYLPQFSALTRTR